MNWYLDLTEFIMDYKLTHGGKVNKVTFSKTSIWNSADQPTGTTKA